MLKGFVIGVAVALMVAAGTAYALIRTGAVPAGTAGGPIFLEQWAASTSLDATLAREAPRGPNPVPLTETSLIDGINIYAKHCVICHGTQAGNAAASPIARGEYPQPPQLASDGVEDDPEGYTFWKLDNGIRWSGMPSWRGTLTPRQMWTVALFLKHMDQLPPAAEQVWKQVGH